MHNDFINLMLTYGYVGVIIYLYVLVTFISKKIRINKSNWFMISLFLVMLVLDINLNIVYTYMCSVIMIPFCKILIELSS